jgi:tRNA dimethylallyltransferase
MWKGHAMDALDGIGRDRPVLIAGPTASGKSALALDLAERFGGVIVNADALQVYRNWRILTARPGVAELARAPHRLYGHVGPDEAYSVGHWLREVSALLAGPDRPIIVGGTGLYFTALTEGLAEVPSVPPEVRAMADERLAKVGLATLLAEVDARTAARIDRRNPARVQRAWEVLQATGRGLADWQDATPPPLLPLTRAQALRLDVDPAVLSDRIARRFDAMLADGVLDEVAANAPDWDPRRPAARAIGALELMGHLRGDVDLTAARHAAIVATRQYAKRQRTWFRARMGTWRGVTRP